MSAYHFPTCLLLASALLAGCGGSTDPQSPNPCSLSNPGGCGGSRPPDPVPGTADPSAKAAVVSVVVSSSELASAGLAGAEVGVTALVKSADNTAVEGATVTFSADSGLLAVSSGVTDKLGKASATLGTGGSRLNRPITVSVRVGQKTASAVVNVVGTQMALAGPSFILMGSSADMVATLLDSAGRPIGGETVSVVAKNGNSVSGATASDSQGQVRLRVAASKRGAEQITVSALGASAAKPIAIGGNEVSITPAVVLDAGGSEVLQEVAIGVCAPVDGVDATATDGSVTLSASRGRLYRDAACTLPLSAPLALSGGTFPRTYISSANAGIATIDASVAGGASGSTRLEFVARLGGLSKISLLADQAVVGAGERSTLIAVVRDGTPANNLVKGATVQFAIAADPSGGNLLSPFSSVTGSDGVARAVFEAGMADGGKDATAITASIAGLPSASATTSLTVNKKALSIQFGTGNSLIKYSDAVLQQDFAVFVADSAGNPVRDVAISAAAWPTHYGKGGSYWKSHESSTMKPGKWTQNVVATCANEDVQRKGLYDRALDTNNNGMLDPGIPMTVISGGKTDAFGMTTVSLRYPRDRAYWVRVELTVTGTVAGTESRARNAFPLLGLAEDYTELDIGPPGEISPYGASLCNING